jgi:hypothetical protein
MNLEYKYLLDGSFNNDSRVWIYQCNRLFSLDEAFQVEDRIKQFAANWQSHGDPVTAEAHLFFGQFIVLIVDETATGVSGCSTDGSVRMIREIEQQFNVQLFDRLSLAFVIKDKIELLPMAQLNYAMQNNFISPDTLYFNNVVQTREEFISKWIIPLKESWLASKFALA